MTGNLVAGVMISPSLQTLGQFRRICCHSLFPPPTNRGMELFPPTWTSRSGLKLFFNVINARLEISCVFLRKSASHTDFCFPASQAGQRGVTGYSWGQPFHLCDICLIFWQVVGQTRAFSQAGDWCGDETGLLRGGDLPPGGCQLWAFAGMWITPPECSSAQITPGVEGQASFSNNTFFSLDGHRCPCTWSYLVFHYGLMHYYIYMYAHKIFTPAAGVQPVFSTAETDLWDMFWFVHRNSWSSQGFFGWCVLVWLLLSWVMSSLLTEVKTDINIHYIPPENQPNMKSRLKHYMSWTYSSYSGSWRIIKLKY